MLSYILNVNSKSVFLEFEKLQIKTDDYEWQNFFNHQFGFSNSEEKLQSMDLENNEPSLFQTGQESRQNNGSNKTIEE